MPHEMVEYTDGSCIQGNDGQSQRLGGASICTYKTLETVIQVQPEGRGLTNTTNRAEISSVHQALKAALNETTMPEILTVYTDSQCAMSLIRKQLIGTHKHYVTVHKALLDETVRTITKLVEAGCKVIMRKVKSHIGVEGNEKADGIAVKTAKGKN